MLSSMPERLFGDSKRLKQVIVNLLKLLLENNQIKVVLVSSDFDNFTHELKIGLFGKRDMDWAYENDFKTLKENMQYLTTKQ